jgi:phosphoribosylformylglycinamidine cyclo-ligase
VLLRRTHSPRVIANEGGFAGLFQLDFDGELFARRYRTPVLVSSTDGVGTKLKVAQRMGRHDTVGIDLVAMCVNDTLCTGAEPLFFLDYVAMAQDDPPLLEQIVHGISSGCVESDMALVGGETAIMPDLYQPGDYDLAGFCVGVAERQRLIDGSSIVPGDAILGIASTGLHSNGYSLVRRVVFELARLDLAQEVPELQTTVGEALLKPTRIYARPVRSILAHYRKKSVVHGIAHITGGGLLENLSRILPAKTSARIEKQSWTVPPVFSWLQGVGKIEEAEMFQVFNMGVGLVLVVSPFFADSIGQQLAEHRLESWQIGEVVAGEGQAAWA